MTKTHEEAEKYVDAPAEQRLIGHFPCNDTRFIEDAHQAGQAAGFKRAVELLRASHAHWRDMNAHDWADWLEKQDD